jgi:hypothetical protein
VPKVEEFSPVIGTAHWHLSDLDGQPKTPFLPTICAVAMKPSYRLQDII